MSPYLIQSASATDEDAGDDDNDEDDDVNSSDDGDDGAEGSDGIGDGMYTVGSTNLVHTHARGASSSFVHIRAAYNQQAHAPALVTIKL